MIINIRGTGGSGKSTIVREVMLRYPYKSPSFIEGRKQPFGYDLILANKRRLWVPGHYETACGGCDTLKSPAQVFETVRDAASIGKDVIFEGIISQDDVKRTIQLSKDFPLVVVALDVPIEECLAGIQLRRDERGDLRPLNPTNTVNRLKSLGNHMRRLKEAGVVTAWLNRRDALTYVLELLGIADYPRLNRGSAVAVQRPAAGEEPRGQQELFDIDG